MLEATRLTRTGRFAEAVALIQHALGQPSLAPEGAGSAAASGDLHGSNVGDGELIQGHPGLGGITITGTHADREGARDYRLHIPAGRTSGGALDLRPLIVMLHGCGQNPDDFAAVTRMSRIADEEGFFVLYPIQALTANAAGCWNWYAAENQRRDQGEPAILAGMTRRILASQAVDPCRVYVAGLSAGGAMAMTMAATYPDLFAAVGIHSGLPHASAHDLVSAMARMGQGKDIGGQEVPGVRGEGIPAIVFHGDADAVVHPANALQVIAQASGRDLGAAGQGGLASGVVSEQGRVMGGYPYTRQRFLDHKGDIQAELWMVHGAGHGWSGGGPGGSFTEPLGPDASREMLRFFWEHPRLAP